MGQKNEIAGVLTAVIRATKHAAHRDYVASSCATRHDFRAADEAEEAFNVAREQAIETLSGMVDAAQALGERTRPDVAAARLEAKREALTAMAHVYVAIREEARDASRKLADVPADGQEGRTLLFHRNDAYARCFGILCAAAAILGRPVEGGSEIEQILVDHVKAVG